MIQLYLDEDITYVLAHALCQRGIDAVSTYELGHLGWKDAEHLEYAVSEARTLFTYNIRDFILEHRRWQEAGKDHYAIVVSPQFSLKQFGELLRRTLRLVSVWTPDKMINQIVYLGKYL